MARSVWGALALAGLVLVAQATAARAENYVVTDLRAMLEEQGLPAIVVLPTAISANGRVVGTWNDRSRCASSQSFYFTPSAPNTSTGTMRDLGNFGYFQFNAQGVNDSGQIAALGTAGVVQCDDPQTARPLIWENGALTVLPTPLLNGQCCQSGAAFAINSSGQAAGSFGFQGSNAARWPDMGFEKLDDSFSVAYAINDLGHATGNSNHLPGSNPFGNAFLSTGGGTLLDLGRLPSPFFFSTGRAINVHDTVVGESGGSANAQHATLFAGGVPQDIDCDTRGTSFPACSGPGTGNSIALGINDAGQVVGQQNGLAFLWDSANGMVDLNTLLPPGSNARLTRATAINNKGQIVAEGLADGVDCCGAVRAYLLTPDVPSDTTPPIIDFTQQPNGSNGWFKSAPASVIVTATDENGSIANLTCSLDGNPVSLSSTSSTATSRSGIVSTSSEGDHIVTCQANDAAGNSASSSTELKLDATPPAITLGSPADGGVYILNAAVASQWTASDTLSGLAASGGTVPSGAFFDTGSVGTKSFTVNASDVAGNVVQHTNSYRVQYAPAGTSCLGSPGHQILAPISTDGTRTVEAGSTVPAKFRVCDANGVSIGTPDVVSGFFLVGGTVTSTPPGTAFRWDPSSQQWIANIRTKGLPANARYEYRIDLNDGSSITFQFALK